MDNPWGSPWADETESPSTNTFTKPTDTNISKTPAKAPSLAFQSSTASPWDDISGDNGDNALGDWAEMPSEKPSTGFGLDGMNDGWNGSVDDIEGLEKQKSGHLPDAWNDEAPIADTNLVPSPLQKDKEIIRQRSIDPWTLETEHAELVVHPPTNAPKEEESKGRSTTKSATQENITNGEILSETVSIDSAIDVFPESVSEVSQETAVQREKVGEEETGLGKEKDTAKVVEKEESPNTNEIGPPSLRPSSSPSDRSQHDEIFSESPRTSFDEEPKLRPQRPRTVSTKVQELVEHFDTIAKEEVPVLISTNSKKKNPKCEGTDQPGDADCNQEEPGTDAESENDDFGDFGDFEDGQSDSESIKDESAFQITATAGDSEQASVKDIGEKDYGPITWTLVIPLLEQIYPDLKDTPEPERVFIPDNIPHDSFASTEERRIWYRLSRYGPMRQHNTRDDENYVRVNWKQSQVRDETLKVVARWIEEDRISGRVILGGGSKAGSIFGWNDPNAKPASISAAFAERKSRKKSESTSAAAPVDVPREWPKGLVKDRSATQGRTSSASRRRTSVKSTTSVDEAKREKTTPFPVANFGWNPESHGESSKKVSSRPSSSHKRSGLKSSVSSATKGSSPKQKRPSRSQHSSTGSVPKVGDLAPQTLFPATKLETILSPSFAKPALPRIQPVQPAPIQPVKQVPDSFNDEEDEDWGEMISSPVAVAVPVLPLNSLRHKKSQSLVGNVSSMRSPTAATILPVNSHRPSMSLDQILSPTQPSPQSSNFVPVTNSVPTLQPFSPAPAVHGSSSNTVNDPWASADFSFFDSPAPASVPASMSKTIASRATTNPNSASIPSPLKSSSLAATTGVPIPSPGTPSTRRTKEEMEQDRIVQGVLKSLPDLSYMFKR
ncbi:hypothetical protein HYALB_00004879 [Hymenoscyphus albidus]|uniref:Uncharacterized protein n=1 Tax=Hymenoscyphus albidus TaxID=595503 RepID=A0A9N9LVK0_9HELO|nr:hypothetical protein HYALB_00004879 [Hymenoscyphus albidus]